MIVTRVTLKQGKSHNEQRQGKNEIVHASRNGGLDELPYTIQPSMRDKHKSNPHGTRVVHPPTAQRASSTVHGPQLCNGQRRNTSGIMIIVIIVQTLHECTHVKQTSPSRFIIALPTLIASHVCGPCIEAWIHRVIAHVTAPFIVLVVEIAAAAGVEATATADVALIRPV